jgi:hypothetical protein
MLTIKVHRNQRGQGLILSVALIAILIGGVVLFTLFLVNAGLTFCYKDRLTLAAEQTALYASGIKKQERQEKSEKFIQDILQQMGFGTRPTEISLSESVSGKTPVLEVNAKRDFPLFVSNLDVLPFQTRIETTGIAPASSLGQTAQEQDLIISGVDNIRGERVELTLPATNIERQDRGVPKSPVPASYVLGPESAYILNSPERSGR